MAEKSKGKVGIMTFHWAANYGAVLQAWALQEYINNVGYKAEIINYVPSNLKISLHRCFMTRHISTMKLRYKEYKKEQLIQNFRKKYFNYSGVEYASKNQLNDNPPLYDFYVSGSDQIWNPYFTMGGQNGVTLSYYLNFAPEGSRRIAFSSSFGCKSLPDNVGNTIRPELNKYYAISTREAEGVEILRSLGIASVNTVDPTILLEAPDYEALLPQCEDKAKNLYVYILHGQRKNAESLIDYVKGQTKLPVCEEDELAVEGWLEHIHNAGYVVTNSFHCVVFCLLFHIPFYAVDVQGKDMSSRITTLLGSVGLEDRFLRLPISVEEIENAGVKTIPWNEVDSRLSNLREYARKYLHQALETRERIDDVPGSQCTGCGLCSVVCPQKCISMVEDNRGYFFPSIDEEKCIHCGICMKKCITQAKPSNSAKQCDTYACWNINEDVRKESSSGGAFTALAETILEEGGIVYGAQYAAPLQVKHASTENAINLSQMRGSKYQPSEAWPVFESIKREIQEGRTVLFAGTPCQVAALKQYIGDTELLICIDIACHGVPSQRILKEKCNSIAKSKVARIDFRDKRSGWKDYSCVYFDSNGVEIAHEIASESDFMRGYLSNLYIRESCEDCRFAAIPRVGDISLADCWIRVHDGSDKDNKGITAILVNSEQGKALYQKAAKKMHTEEISIDHVLKGTPTLMQGSRPSSQRAQFWNYYGRYGYQKTMRKFFGITILKRKILRTIKKQA